MISIPYIVTYQRANISIIRTDQKQVCVPGAWVLYYGSPVPILGEGLFLLASTSLVANKETMLLLPYCTATKLLKNKTTKAYWPHRRSEIFVILKKPS